MGALEGLAGFAPGVGCCGHRPQQVPQEGPLRDRSGGGCEVLPQRVAQLGETEVSEGAALLQEKSGGSEIPPRAEGLTLYEVGEIDEVTLSDVMSSGLGSIGC